MADPLIHVALLNPEIPQNAGNIGRLCLGIGARLHLIHPLGFSLEDRYVRRAGLDYWRDVDKVEHVDFDAFERWAVGRRVIATSSHGTRSYAAVRWEPGDVLLFGCETVGLPAAVARRYDAVSIPMPGPIRSLNLANAAAVVAYAALRDVAPEWFQDPSRPM